MIVYGNALYIYLYGSYKTRSVTNVIVKYCVSDEPSFNAV